MTFCHKVHEGLNGDLAVDQTWECAHSQTEILAEHKAERPCSCWGVATVHSGHCCFRDLPDNYPESKPLPCGHDAAGQLIAEAYRLGEVVDSR